MERDVEVQGKQTKELLRTGCTSGQSVEKLIREGAKEIRGDQSPQGLYSCHQRVLNREN